MTDEEVLALNFRDGLDLPQDAIDWLLGLWNLIQVLDDVADGDHIDRADMDRAIWDCLAGLPSNSFYQRHQSWLIPALAQAVLKWMASNIAERSGVADERSYMWRAGYYDVVCLVTSLVHGPSSERAYNALALYGEGCAEYMKEFSDA
jgi:hypothetical protein